MYFGSSAKPHGVLLFFEMTYFYNRGRVSGRGSRKSGHVSTKGRREKRTAFHVLNDVQKGKNDPPKKKRKKLLS